MAAAQGSGLAAKKVSFRQQAAQEPLKILPFMPNAKRIRYISNAQGGNMELKFAENGFVLPASGKPAGNHKWTIGSDVQSVWRQFGWTPPSESRRDFKKKTPLFDAGHARQQRG
jgi:hypothetical protein